MNTPSGGQNGAQTLDRYAAGLGWREAGAGQPVVFLHGLGGSRISWGPQLEQLSAQFRCIAWDMPGYGVSEPLVPLTYPGIASRLINLLDELELEQVDLVGLSFGGMHALHTALLAPQRIRRLVLADTSPAFGMDGTTKQEWMQSRLAPIEQGGTPADGAERVVDLITAIRLTGQIRQDTIASFGRIPVDGFRAAVRCLPDNDVRADLHRIEHPSCVIVGENDAETPPAYAKTLADGLPNSELHIIAEAGHLTPAETPEQFNQLVEQFLS